VTERPQPDDRAAYPWHFVTRMRWGDADVYGHLNNARYIEYFDTALNVALIEHGALDLSPDARGPIGLVARNEADFFSEVTFPAAISVGVRVERIGRTSLAWGFGLFACDEPLAAARGRIIHVYVERRSRRPARLAGKLLTCAEALSAPPAGTES
jgi:acyl-CoA thioester hydrolase